MIVRDSVARIPLVAVKVSMDGTASSVYFLLSFFNLIDYIYFVARITKEVNNASYG